MVTDPVADLLIRIKNAARRGHETTKVPASRLKRDILKVLKSEGYIAGFEAETQDGHLVLTIALRYVGEGQPVISGMTRISKPGRRVYVGHDEVRPVMGGMGTAVISTSKGVLTDRESRQARLGGEVLCHVW